ncbi:MAG: hypothetical protein ACLFUS_16635 [Candidatus Sumerlaeia bacterium]
MARGLVVSDVRRVEHIRTEKARDARRQLEARPGASIESEQDFCTGMIQKDQTA